MTPGRTDGDERPPAHASPDLARQDTGLSQHQLWVRFVGLGGMTPAMEMAAVCHKSMVVTATDPDRIGQALNERFTGLGRNHPVPSFDDSGDPCDPNACIPGPEAAMEQAPLPPSGERGDPVSAESSTRPSLWVQSIGDAYDAADFTFSTRA